MKRRDVSSWHFRDMRQLRIHVSLPGKSGHAADTAKGPSLTHLGHWRTRSNVVPV